MLLCCLHFYIYFDSQYSKSKIYIFSKQTTVSDNANFSLNPLANNTLIDVGSFADFSIDYLGLANATATVTVTTNALNQNPYQFDIKGSTSIPDPCVGIILAPNPSPSFITPNLIIPVANNNTFVFAAIYTPSGTLLYNLMMDYAASAGTYSLPINIAGLPSGIYPIVVYRDNDMCNTIKLVVL